MPKLSLYRPNKQNDFRFMDRTISEMFTVGGTDLYIHKYLGPNATTPSNDATQPQYAELKPTNIQDLLFLENRDRIYDKNIYRLRGHYNVANLDFDLTQFGLFLNNDIIFVTVHYNDMIDIVGRKLMVGDVLELPHLLDYNPLDEKIPTALKRFYQITDANFASEGFSQTWYPHLWRIKCEPLVNTQEFEDILKQPTNQDNYLGDWSATATYPPGYTINYGDKIYESIKDVPAGKSPPDPEYWKELTNDSLADIISTYNKNIAINNAALEEAKRLVPLSGYDNKALYVVPTYGAWGNNCVPSSMLDQPAPPVNIITYTQTGVPITGTVVMMKSPNFKNPSPAIKIPKQALASIWDMTVDISSLSEKLDKFTQADLEIAELSPEKLSTGSGSVETTKVMAVQPMGMVTGPYGTADNTYATADQDPEQPGFIGEITPEMDYRADCDPRFQYIARYSPRSFGYAAGYLTGDGLAPNGFPTGMGIAFPQSPKVGDYFLRIDYYPQLLFRWDGCIWVRISAFVRTATGFTAEDESLRSRFINDDKQIYVNNGRKEIPERQALSKVLQIQPDDLPPVE